MQETATESWTLRPVKIGYILVKGGWTRTFLTDAAGVLNQYWMKEAQGVLHADFLEYRQRAVKLMKRLHTVYMSCIKNVTGEMRSPGLSIIHNQEWTQLYSHV